MWRNRCVSSGAAVAGPARAQEGVAAQERDASATVNERISDKGKASMAQGIALLFMIPSLGTNAGQQVVVDVRLPAGAFANRGGTCGVKQLVAQDVQVGVNRHLPRNQRKLFELGAKPAANVRA